MVSENDGIDLVSLPLDVCALTTRRAELDELKSELESSIANAGKQHVDLSDRARAVVLQLDGQESKLGKQIADRHVSKAEDRFQSSTSTSTASLSTASLSTSTILRHSMAVAMDGK